MSIVDVVVWSYILQYFATGIIQKNIIFNFGSLNALFLKYGTYFKNTFFCPYLRLFVFQINKISSTYPFIKNNIVSYKFVGKY